jgi:quercetin dioxygenase-like cupin family protein
MCSKAAGVRGRGAAGDAQGGDVLFIPAGTIHAAKNVGSGNAVELATYVLEKGKPPLELVK